MLSHNRILFRDVPNIRVVFASVPNSAPNSRPIRIRTNSVMQSVPAALPHIAWLWETNEGERVMARQHAGTIHDT